MFELYVKVFLILKLDPETIFSIKTCSSYLQRSYSFALTHYSIYILIIKLSDGYSRAAYFVSFEYLPFFDKSSIILIKAFKWPLKLTLSAFKIT